MPGSGIEGGCGAVVKVNRIAYASILGRIAAENDVRMVRRQCQGTAVLQVDGSSVVLRAIVLEQDRIRISGNGDVAGIQGSPVIAGGIAGKGDLSGIGNGDGVIGGNGPSVGGGMVT